MHDPMTLIYGCRLFTLWHVDPEKDGSDDSCGWFKRARHGDKEVLEKIIKRFEFDWDSTFTSGGDPDDDESGPKRTYFTGLFRPDGDPNLSVYGITMNLFWTAAFEYFKQDRDKAHRFLKNNLTEILLFSENPVDSLYDGITRKFEKGCGVVQDKRSREERVRNMASTIYGWILRAEQKWWQHPRWHIHHWKLVIHPIQRFKRWVFTRCMKCGKRVGWTTNVVSHQWDSEGPQWFKSEQVECPCCHSAMCAQLVKQ